MLKNPFFLRCFLFFLEPYREDDGGAVARNERDRAQRAGQPHDTLADALSTALFVMGLDAGAEFQKSSGLAFEAVFVTDDNTVWITPGLAGRYRSDRPYQILE